MKNNFLGQAGFTWWLGVVENRNDPLNVGRCQVRIFGWHTDNLQLIPSKDLPWAHPVWPINDSATSKTPKEGDYIVGFFYDGESGQFPAYFGVIPGIPTVEPNQAKGFSDQRTSEQLSKSPTLPEKEASLYPNVLNEPTTSRLYRNEKIEETIIQSERDAVVKEIPTPDSSWDQPEPSYAAVPPYNSVYDSESGHAMEFDDTKDAERIHIAHRTGTYTEMRPDGSKVTRVVKNNYEIISGDDFVNIIGNANITVNGNANIYVKGNVVEKIDGNCNQTVGGSFNSSIGGTCQITSGGNMTLKAPKIDLNP
jgi:hypothetical protein